MLKINPDRLFSPDEVQAKREQLLSIIMDSIKQVTELESGYQLRFSPKNEDLVLLSDWIQAERMCNPFLRFQMAAESNNGPLTCDMSGPSGTKYFLTSSLGLNRWL